MPIFARIRMTWTPGIHWAYDADREEIRYKGEAPQPLTSPPQQSSQGHASSSQPAVEELEDEEEDPEGEKEPENEPVTRSDDAVVPDVGSGGPKDP
ncbi:ribonuclease E/G [Sesbania bispinosa]|nr:ribonuclease E/G [Sesbania bispinosa]